MGPIGLQEMMAIGLIALLLFGPKKLPELGKMVGKGLREFRRIKGELSSTFETHMRELEREANLADANKASANKAITPATDYSSVSYPHPYEDSRAYNPAVETSVAETTHQSAIPEPVAPAVNGTVARSAIAAPVVPATEEERPA